jgi:2-polyprenyl-3-methyl-5-hydroxy-6-metoxy-1,4-benzoquinol methylase
MPTPAQTVFDNKEFRERFLAKRQNPRSVNNQLDMPAILARVSSHLEGAKVLEIGCGIGEFAMEAERKGASEYLGIDCSQEMIALALARKSAGLTSCHFLCADVEQMEFTSVHYDLIVSMLAFHFISDLEGLLAKLASALVPGGKLVFSMRHPLRTSNPAGIQADRRSWLVSNYFKEGPRELDWHGHRIIIFHRTLSTLLKAVTSASLVIEALDEVSALEKDVLDTDKDHVDIPGIISFSCLRIK